MQQAFFSGYVMQHTFIGLFSWITAMTIKITEERGKDIRNSSTGDKWKKCYTEVFSYFV
jgi:hypothetical protein